MKKYLVAAIVLFASSAYAQVPSNIDPNWQTKMAQQPVAVDIGYYRNRIADLDFMAARLTTENQQLQQQIQMLGKQLADAQAAAKKAADDAKDHKDKAATP